MKGLFVLIAAPYSVATSNDGSCLSQHEGAEGFLSTESP